MTLYLGNNLISGVQTLVGESRNIGQIIPSAIPLTDAGLHLLDGTLINGAGIYSDFVTAMGNIYSTTEVVGYKSNVTKVGSVVDIDGVLSNFSTSNYATLPTTFNPQNNSIEIVIKFKLTSTNTASYLFSGRTNQYIHIYVNSSNKICLDIGNGSSWVFVDISGTTTLSANIDYYVKLVFDGTKYIVSLSTDNDTWTQEISQTTTQTIPSCQLNLGISRSIDVPLLGTIDLKESYININGNRWWTGAEPVKPIFCDEEQWQNSVNTYGVCGKFVYDSVANTVRLPKVTGILEGTTDATALGDLIEQFVRLPNIWGTTGGNEHSEATSNTGCFYSYNYGGSSPASGSGSNYGHAIDASLCSDVYSGNGTDTVIQPQAIKCYYYIVIATSTKTDIQVDIDEIATDLNSKMDVDLSNMSASQSAKNEIISWGMPDYTAGVSITSHTSSSNQFTAPCDGIIKWGARLGSLAYLNGVLYNTYNTNNTIAGNNMLIIMNKNDTFYATEFVDNSTMNNMFFPMKGAN